MLNECTSLISCSFYEMSRSIYTVEIQADDEYVMVNIPENITGDVAGNKNLPSNILQVRNCKIFISSAILALLLSNFFK